MSRVLFTTEKNYATVGGRVVTLPDNVAASQIYLEK